MNKYNKTETDPWMQKNSHYQWGEGRGLGQDRGKGIK